MTTELTKEEYLAEVAQRLSDYLNEEGTREELNSITFSSDGDLDFTLDELESGAITFEECVNAIVPTGINFRV